MANNRQWRVTGSFLRVGEVAVIVQSPNWQGALRKGALEIKRLPQLKGRRLSKGVFTVNKQDELVEAITGPQLSIPEAGNQADTGAPPVEAISAIPQAAKCSNPNCNQSFAHEGMCDNYVPDNPVETEEVNGNVAEVPLAQETTGPKGE